MYNRMRLEIYAITKKSVYYLFKICCIKYIILFHLKNNFRREQTGNKTS